VKSCKGFLIDPDLIGHASRFDLGVSSGCPADRRPEEPPGDLTQVHGFCVAAYTVYAFCPTLMGVFEIRMPTGVPRMTQRQHVSQAGLASFEVRRRHSKPIESQRSAGFPVTG
jgi:hypothetical protein